MWGLAAWVEHFQAILWQQQTGKPFTGRLGDYAVRAVWVTTPIELDVGIRRGGKLEWQKQKEQRQGWVWEMTPLPSRVRR